MRGGAVRRAGYATVLAEAGIGLGSALYQAAGEAWDRQRFAPPGRMVDVGGRRLHLLDMGSGSPAVVIVPGIGATALDWRGRVLPYGRCGVESLRVRPGRVERPAAARAAGFDGMAADLRQALAAAGVEPPWLLVGHSMGGIIVRQLATQFRSDVAGLVLVESSHEQQARRFQVGSWPWRHAGSRTAFLAVRYRLMILGCRRMRVQRGCGRLRAELAAAALAEDKAAAVAVALTRRYRRVVAGELWLNSRPNGRPADLGDLPVLVMTGAGRGASWMELQGELARLSTRARHVIADHGGHALQQENPALVLAAIRCLREQAKQSASSLR